METLLLTEIYNQEQQVLQAGDILMQLLPCPHQENGIGKLLGQGGAIDGSNGFCCGLADSVQVELTRDINSNSNNLYLRQNQKYITMEQLQIQFLVQVLLEV